MLKLLGQVENAISLNHSLLASMAAVRFVCCKMPANFSGFSACFSGRPIALKGLAALLSYK